MKKYSDEEKEMWLEDWQRSGKSVWAYAKENGLIPQTFNNWTKQRKQEPEQPLVEIPVEILQPTRHAQEILIEKGNVKIHIPLEPVLNEMYKLIAKLGQAL